MATEGGGKEMNEIKTQFTTREGLYKLLPHSEYSRPNRVPFNSQGSNPVRVSFVNLNDQSGNGDRLCFNVGRELYFYIYKGVRKMREKLCSPCALPLERETLNFIGLLEPRLLT
ncbi:WD repeat-containing protein 20 isoform X11 [Tamandua tetradactyla]|uniref:WD repeat-containing protein 20 isoform X11 n=1 Tax=Tamandua tetradactyla TaxID=48850 RepID=UPI004053EF9A